MTNGRTGLLAFLILGCWFVTGCGSRPHAPAILDDPVYENDRQGFRFRAPEGWHQVARADLPAGKLDKERLLVQYRRFDSARPASLEVSAADLPAATDLAAYLAGPAAGIKEWRLLTTEPVPLSTVAGTRYQFTAHTGRDDMAREVAAFPRGERVYFFTIVYLAKDTSAQEQFRRTLGRLDWR
jgi:hypothetical protein